MNASKITFLLFSFFISSTFSFIINGNEVKSSADYPFIVKILPVGCAGVIIDKRWVLTAAHCKMGINNILAGQIDLRKKTSDDQLFRVSNRIIHPKSKKIRHSNFSPVHYDFQLLRLKNDLDLTKSNIGKIPLATKEDARDYLISGELFKVIGWGATKLSGYGSSKVLNELEVPFINYIKSNHRDAYAGVIDPESMLTAGYMEGGKDSCHGDSGGPLFKMINGENKLFGIVSGGKACAQKNKPGVYSKVPSILNWIKETIQSEYTCRDINILFINKEVKLRYRNRNYILSFSKNKKGSKLYTNRNGAKLSFNKRNNFLSFKEGRKKVSCYLDQYKFTGLLQ